MDFSDNILPAEINASSPLVESFAASVSIAWIVPHPGCLFAFHSENPNRVRRSLWNSGIEMADCAIRIFRAGLAEDARHWRQFLRRYQEVTSRLDEVRSYLRANEATVT
jgi:hypothetical protein